MAGNYEEMASDVYDKRIYTHVCKLKKIKCNNTEDITGADEIRIWVKADNGWADKIYLSMKSGQEKEINKIYYFKNSVKVGLLEIDGGGPMDPHDYFGEHEIGTRNINGVIKFRYHRHSFYSDASYHIFYYVTRVKYCSKHYNYYGWGLPGCPDCIREEIDAKEKEEKEKRKEEQRKRRQEMIEKFKKDRNIGRLAEDVKRQSIQRAPVVIKVKETTIRKPGKTQLRKTAVKVKPREIQKKPTKPVKKGVKRRIKR